MLFAIDNTGSLRQVTDVPHRVDFQRWRAGLSDFEYDAIAGELNQRIAGKDIDCASWIPGADWTGTPFLPIWIACGQDFNASRQFFGLILWKVVMERTDRWFFGRYDVNGWPIEGMFYFRIS